MMPPIFVLLHPTWLWSGHTSGGYCQSEPQSYPHTDIHGIVLLWPISELEIPALMNGTSFLLWRGLQLANTITLVVPSSCSW